ILTSSVLAVSTCVGQITKVELDNAPQKIKDWGYLIKTVKGWGSIPARPEEKNVVGHWKPNLDQAHIRGDFEYGQLCELKVSRIPPQMTKTPGADGKIAEPEPSQRPTGFKELDKRINPKSLDEWIEANYEGASKRWSRKALKGAKMQGDYVEF